MRSQIDSLEQLHDLGLENVEAFDVKSLTPEIVVQRLVEGMKNGSNVFKNIVVVVEDPDGTWTATSNGGAREIALAAVKLQGIAMNYADGIVVDER